eukprot:1229219-Alexandrium_andersonii.AAC.1
MAAAHVVLGVIRQECSDAIAAALTTHVLFPMASTISKDHIEQIGPLILALTKLWPDGVLPGGV